MRVCVPTDTPGGPSAPVADRFQDSDLLDFYESADDGMFLLLVQIRNCAGTCKDDVETVVRRGAEAVVAKSMTSSTLGRFTRSGVTVYRALDGPSKNSLAALHRKALAPLDRIKS